MTSTDRKLERRLEAARADYQALRYEGPRPRFDAASGDAVSDGAPRSTPWHWPRRWLPATAAVLTAALLFVAVRSELWLRPVDSPPSAPVSSPTLETATIEAPPSETTPSETTPSETTPSETTPSETTPSETTPPTPPIRSRLAAPSVGPAASPSAGLSALYREVSRRGPPPAPPRPLALRLAPPPRPQALDRGAR